MRHETNALQPLGDGELGVAGPLGALSDEGFEFPHRRHEVVAAHERQRAEHDERLRRQAIQKRHLPALVVFTGQLEHRLELAKALLDAFFADKTGQFLDQRLAARRGIARERLIVKQRLDQLLRT